MLAPAKIDRPAHRLLAGLWLGEEDIDILVHPRDASLLQQANAANGYKCGAGHPGVFHATALDEDRGQLDEKPERRAERRYSFLYVFRKYLVAHDRRHLLTRAMRAATAGTIVISDRCPGTNFTGVDGSAFDDAAVERASSRLQRWLMQKERQIYATLPKPRLVVKLTADVATAIRRDSQRKKKGGPDSGTIRRRWSLESMAEFEGSSVALIDASGALDDTLRQCLREAWAAL